MGRILSDMRRNSIKNAINDMKHFSRLIKEAYVYDEVDPSMGEEPMGNEEMGGSDGDAMEVINQMRELALNGIQIYKNNVDDPKYEFFKKIFLETDKVLSEKNEENID